MAKLNEHDVLSIVKKAIQESEALYTTKLKRDRIKSNKYYDGALFGWERDGRSKYVSRDVFEIVENIMPDLMRIFTSDDRIGHFEPQGPEDEERMEQATDTVNYVFNRQNDGYRNTEDVLRDGLLNKFGLFKAYWDDGVRRTKEHSCGITWEQVEALNSDAEVEIPKDGIEQYVDEDAQRLFESKYKSLVADLPTGSPVPPPPPPQYLYDVHYIRTTKKGQIRIEVVPPENFLIPNMASALDATRALTHQKLMTASELREMGFTQKQIDACPMENEDDLSDLERQNRHKQSEDIKFPEASLDPSMKQIWVNETYMRLDCDNDGVAEFRQIITAGKSGTYLLDNVEVDEHPFFIWSPIRRPHRAIGHGVAETVTDIQEINSTLMRLGLDSLYHTVLPRTIYGPGVNVDALQNPIPGQAIYAENPDMVKPLIQAPMSGAALSMIEHMAGVKEQRTGITKYNQGLDADTLNNHTATGMKMIRSAGQDRVELIAREAAETLFKPLCKRIYKLLRQNQDRAMTIRLRNQWVEVNPTDWKDEADFTVTVGLGTGDRELEKQNFMSLLAIYKDVIGMQGGVQGPLVTISNVHNAATKLVTAMGVKSPELYFSNPAGMPVQQPQQGEQQDPMTAVLIQKAKVETEIATIKAKNQMELDRQRQAFEMELEIEKAKHEVMIEQFKAQAKVAISTTEAEAKLRAEMIKTVADIQKSNNGMMP